MQGSKRHLLADTPERAPPSQSPARALPAQLPQVIADGNPLLLSFHGAMQSAEGTRDERIAACLIPGIQGALKSRVSGVRDHRHEPDERNPTMTPPEHVQFLSPATLAPTPGFSHVVKVTGGQTIYLAGQVALDASGALVGRGDFRTQAHQVFDNIKTALAAVGADFSHVVKLTMYVVDRSHLPTLREVRDLYVNTQAPPASTLVEVRSLFQEDFLLEVEAIASLPA